MDLTPMQCRLNLDISWRALLGAALGPPVQSGDVDAARIRMRKTFSTGHMVLGLSVRTLFDAILSERALPKDAAILMSGVNIQNMADIVAAHELRVAAVDIETETLSPKPGALIAAHHETAATVCVVSHLFGTVNAIADAPELRRKGVFIIEDAAQAFAGAFYRGADAADVSLFSFGPIKRRTALGGAIAVFRDAELAENVARRLDTYPARGELWFRQRALKYLALKTASTPWIYGLLMKVLAATGKDVDAFIGGAARGFQGTDIVQAIRHRPPMRMVALLAHQIGSSPPVSARQQICRDFLRVLPDRAKFGASAHDNAYWLMPIRAKHPARLIERLRAAGFDATRGATSLHALAPSQTPQSARVIEDVVYVPHPADLSVRARHGLQRAIAEALLEDV